VSEDEPHPRHESHQRPSGDWGWDPAAGPPSESRFQPSRRAKAIVAIVTAIAMVGTVILLCVFGAQFLNVLLAAV
jgi:hypothetical protein